jgi:hypothetical protein
VRPPRGRTYLGDAMPDGRTIVWLYRCNVLMLAALAVLLFEAAAAKPAVELSVERLNIVDGKGRPVLVLSNAARLPGARFGHKEYPQSFVGRGRSAGMIFLNEVGDEVGGLVYEGAPTGEGYRAFGHLSFDQWKQSQVVAIQYQDDGASRTAGLRVWDRPTDAPLETQFLLAERMLKTAPGPARETIDRERRQARDRVAGTPRLFVGSQDKVAKVELRDALGHVRARLAVDAAGAAHLEFLDEAGKTTAVYP